MDHFQQCMVDSRKFIVRLCIISIIRITTWLDQFCIIRATKIYWQFNLQSHHTDKWKSSDLKIYQWYNHMDHRKSKDTSRRRTFLDIIWTSQEDEWSLRAKRMATSALFFWLQVNRRLQSWDTGKKIFRSCSRSLTTSN